MYFFSALIVDIDQPKKVMNNFIHKYSKRLILKSKFYKKKCLYFLSILDHFQATARLKKTLPKSSLQMHWVSVRFYEMKKW